MKYVKETNKNLLADINRTEIKIKLHDFIEKGLNILKKIEKNLPDLYQERLKAYVQEQ